MVERKADRLTSWKSEGLKVVAIPVVVRNAPVVVEVAEPCYMAFKPRLLF